MCRRFFLTLTTLAIVSLVPVGAHHSISEVYDIQRTVTIEGRISDFAYQDPHAFVHLRVVRENGRSRTWAVELEGSTKLQQVGIRQETLQPGDLLIFCGNPGWDASRYRLLMLEFHRASDGLTVRREPLRARRECAR